MTTAVLLAIALLSTPAAAPGDAAAFTARCAACHGPDGRGRATPGKTLPGADLTATRLDASAIERVVARGRGAMRPLGGAVSPAESRQAARYVESLREALRSVDTRGVLERGEPRSPATSEGR